MLCTLNEDNKKNNKKIPLFPKNVEHFAFLQMRWNVKAVNKILVIKWLLLMEQVSLYFNTKMPGKKYTIGVF